MIAGEPLNFNESWETVHNECLIKLEEYLINKSGSPFTNKEYSKYYTLIYNLCLQRNQAYSAQLYIKYGESITNFLSDKVLPLLTLEKGEGLLSNIEKHWQNHKIMVKWMQRLFTYLDRFYVKQECKPTLAKQGFELFKQVVFVPLKAEIVDSLLQQIKDERETSEITSSLIKEVVSIFITLGEDKKNNLLFYQQEFEKHYVEQTKEYFIQVAGEWVMNDSCPEYMLKATKLLKHEEQRVQSYLHPTSACIVGNLFNEEIILKYQTDLLEKESTGLSSLLKHERIQDLNRIFHLFSRIKNGLLPISICLRKHITQEGDQILQSLEHFVNNADKKIKPKDILATKFMDDLLFLLKIYNRMMKECFMGNLEIMSGFQGGLETFLNRELTVTIRIPELLALFSDQLLRKSNIKQSDDELEECMEEIVQLFSHLTDKDVFIEYYRSYLAKRVLLDIATNNDAEKSMISKLKMMCGPNFTSKIEGMMSDLNLAKEIQKDFGSWSVESKATFPFEFEVTVLTSGYWPSYRSTNCELLSEMKLCLQYFEHFYNDSNTHKILKWCFSNGSMQVSSYFEAHGGKKYDIGVTTYQGIILLLFNNKSEISFNEIQNIMDFDEELCKKQLHSLVFMKYRLLNKSPNIKTFSTTDMLSINTDFYSMQRKFKLPTPVLAENITTNKVQIDRSIAIEAAIVRIMKSRKRLEHNILIQEVLMHLNAFKPDVSQIKSKIEALVGKDYLERDTDDVKIYKYLA